MAGALLGPAAVDLVLRAGLGLAVVGDQGQVGGQYLGAAAQGLGQVVPQGGVEAALELVGGGEGGPQGLTGGLAGGGAAEAPAGVGQGGQPGAGGAQQADQGRGGAGAAVVGQADVGLDQVGGAGVGVVAGEDILGVAHGPLLSWLGVLKPFKRGALRPSHPTRPSLQLLILPHLRTSPA